MDGNIVEMPREKTRRIVPFTSIFSSPHLKKPYTALFCYLGDIIPVVGPIIGTTKCNWILLTENYAMLIDGIPEYIEEEESSNIFTLGRKEDSAA